MSFAKFCSFRLGLNVLIKGLLRVWLLMTWLTMSSSAIVLIIYYDWGLQLHEQDSSFLAFSLLTDRNINVLLNVLEFEYSLA